MLMHLSDDIPTMPHTICPPFFSGVASNAVHHQALRQLAQLAFALVRTNKIRRVSPKFLRPNIGNTCRPGLMGCWYIVFLRGITHNGDRNRVNKFGEACSERSHADIQTTCTALRNNSTYGAGFDSPPASATKASATLYISNRT